MHKKPKPVVYIVDDDESVRRALVRLVRSAGMNAESFSGANEFLHSKHQDTNACLLTDIKMPEMGGLELQTELIQRGNPMPVIFITAFDTPETRDQAKKAGAVGYFRKPVDDQALLDQIQWVLTKKNS